MTLWAKERELDAYNEGFAAGRRVALLEAAAMEVEHLCCGDRDNAHFELCAECRAIATYSDSILAKVEINE